MAKKQLAVMLAGTLPAGAIILAIPAGGVPVIDQTVGPGRPCNKWSLSAMRLRPL